MSTFLSATGAWISAHQLAFAWFCAALLSVLAWFIHRPKVQAFLVRYPVAFVVLNFVAQRLLAFVAAIGGDIPKALASFWAGQQPTAPLPFKPLTVSEAASVADVLSKEKGT